MRKLFNLLRYLPDFNRLRASYGAKGWYKSKTIWFNTLTFASAVAVTLWGDRFGLSDAQAMGLATMLSATINYALRLATLEPVWRKEGGWLRSRTLWVNGAALFSALAVLLYGDAARLAPAELAAMGVGLHTLVNIGLRFSTRQGLALRDIPPAADATSAETA